MSIRVSPSPSKFSNQGDLAVVVAVVVVVVIAVVREQAGDYSHTRTIAAATRIMGCWVIYCWSCGLGSRWRREAFDSAQASGTPAPIQVSGTVDLNWDKDEYWSLSLSI